MNYYIDSNNTLYELSHGIYFTFGTWVPNPPIDDLRPVEVLEKNDRD